MKIQPEVVTHIKKVMGELTKKIKHAEKLKALGKWSDKQEKLLTSYKRMMAKHRYDLKITGYLAKHAEYLAKMGVSITPLKKLPGGVSGKRVSLRVKTRPVKSPKIKIPSVPEIEKMSKLKDNLDYLKYILRHKSAIMRPSRKLGIPFKQALKHDMSKLTKEEWGPYRDYFYSDRGIRGTNDPEVYKAFREAVTTHKKRNPHHITSDSSIEHRVEAVVDWYAAEKAQSAAPRNFPSFKEWYLENREELMADPDIPVDANLDFYIMRKLQ